MSWKEVAIVTATFHEPGLEPEDATGVEVWAPNDNPNAQWVEYEMASIWTGSAPLYRPSGLVEYLDSRSLLREELDTIKQIIDAERLDNAATVALLTVWECESGYSYVPGEPSEYEANAQLVGYYKPKTLEYVAVEI